VVFGGTEAAFPDTGHGGRALEIQGGIQTSSAAGLSKYWEGQIDPTLIAAALAASEQAGRTLALHPSLLRQPVLWKLLGEIDWYKECFARCNFKGRISHCATIKMQRVRRSLYFFAIQLLKCAEIHFIWCNCRQLAVSYCS